MSKFKDDDYCRVWPHGESKLYQVVAEQDGWYELHCFEDDQAIITCGERMYRADNVIDSDFCQEVVFSIAHEDETEIQKNINKKIRERFPGLLGSKETKKSKQINWAKALGYGKK